VWFKNNRANATHELSPVRKMLRDRTEVMLDQRGRGTGPGPALRLVLVLSCSLLQLQTSRQLHVSDVCWWSVIDC